MVAQFLNQLRVLFPRWNFFDQLGHRFYLKYKTTENQNWISIKFKSEWSLLNFFCNPDHNLTLAQISAIELFAQDAQMYDEQQIQNLDSFRLIRSLIGIHAKTKKFQFTLEAHKDGKILDLYISPWIQEKPCEF